MSKGKMPLRRENFRKLHRRHNVARWIFSFSLAAACLLFLCTVWFAWVKMGNDSMAPTLQKGDLVLVNRMRKYYKEIERTDMVAFYRPGTKELLIKRVVATGGESVQGQNGSIWIDEKYCLSEEEYGVYATYKDIFERKLHMPRHEYFSRSFDGMLTAAIYDFLAIIQRQRRDKQEQLSRYEAITHYVDEHLDEPLSLDALARQFYLSKYYLVHLFRENSGLSVHQYILKKRLAACCDAIQGGAPVGEAYRQWGFGDYSAFYRAFRKEYGMSPSAFLELHAP